MRLVSYTRIVPFQTDAPTVSIAEQNERIANYAKQCGMQVAKQYSDRKNDPKADSAFMKLLEDGIHRRFDAVIVDSFFYAGRSFGQAREVMLQTFYPAGIHFIIAEDGFISFEKTKEEVTKYFWRKEGGYKNRMIKDHMQQRNLEGKFNIQDVKYGFRLTDDGQMQADPNTAPVVHEIFSSFVEGKSTAEIARSLQEQKIAVPSVARGEKRNLPNPFHWGGKTIINILKSPVYSGCWTKTVKGQSVTLHNEPLVEQELFEKANSRMKTDPKKRCPKNRNSPYVGLLYDIQHGFCTHRRKTVDNRVYYYNSVMGIEDGKRKPWLYETELENAVRLCLKQEQQRAERILNRIQTEGDAVREQEIERWKDHFRDRMKTIVKSERSRMETYKAFRAGTVSEAEWQSVQERAKQIVRDFEPSFSEYKSAIAELEKTDFAKNPWLQLFLQYDDAKPFNRELVKQYVQRIYISQMKITSIELKLQEHYQKLPEIWRSEYGT